MFRRIALSCLALAVVWLAGCGASGKSGPPVAQVEGTVTVDGKVLPDGEISFSLPGQTPSVLPIKDGVFSGEAMVGKNRVEIFAYKEGPPLSTDPSGPPTKVNYVSERYNARTKLEADVPAEGASELTFAVTSN